MPQGQPISVPDDGLTTRQRRNAPVLAVHTGVGKGKSTAAFGMALRAWNAGMDIAVFQFVKSAKWKVGEESVFERLGRAGTRLLRSRRVHLPTHLGVGRRRRGGRYIAGPAGSAACRDHRARRPAATARSRRSGD